MAPMTAPAQPLPPPLDAANHGPTMLSQDKNCLHYPFDARVSHVEGIVKISLVVAADGSTRDIILAASSGNSDLDQAALECVKSRTFSAALKDGQPVDTALDSLATYAIDPRGHQLSVVWSLGKNVLQGTTLASGGISVSVLACVRAAPDAPTLALTVTSNTVMRILYDHGEIDHASVMVSSGVPALDKIALDCFAAVPKDPERAKTMEKTRFSLFAVPWQRLFPAMSAATK